MDCPVCKNVSLVMSERQGIEIDYCPNCRGVWLDRGELDKIIERSAEHAAPAPSVAQQQGIDPRYQQPAPPDPRYQPQSGGYPQGHGHSHYPPYHKKKRKGFLGELFDFD